MSVEFVDPQEEARQQTLAGEDAVVQALFGAARSATVPVAALDVPRLQVPDETDASKLVPFSFRVQGLKFQVLDQCSRDATRRERDWDAPGKQFRDVMDNPEFASEVVYQATVPEDRKRFWDNPKLQQAFNAGTGAELVGAMLLAGELSGALQQVMELSGFGGDNAVREQVKN